MRRDGNTAGPFTENDSEDYPFAAGRSTYARNGKFVRDGGPCAFDIVAVFDHFPTNEEVLQVKAELNRKPSLMRLLFKYLARRQSPFYFESDGTLVFYPGRAIVYLVALGLVGFLIFGCRAAVTEPCVFETTYPRQGLPDTTIYTPCGQPPAECTGKCAAGVKTKAGGF